MEIKMITENKKQFLYLFLLADEQEDMIDRYLEAGDMFALYDGGLKGVCVVARPEGQEADSVYEIKNIAVRKEYQRKGYGKKLMEHVVCHYTGRCRAMLVGTGDSPFIISFYERCGFRYSHHVKNFFIENYNHPMFEDGVQLTDMVYLRKEMPRMKEIYLAGGCFWGVEKYLSGLDGVTRTNAGYANGKTENPSYEEVCGGQTGHAETVKVLYNPKILPLRRLLDLFYEVIDPTSVNRQGPDAGTQYRTGVYFTDASDREAVVESIKELAKKYEKPIAVEVKELENYSPAEEYHQKYLEKNPGGYCHIKGL